METLGLERLGHLLGVSRKADTHWLPTASDFLEVDRNGLLGKV